MKMNLEHGEQSIAANSFVSPAVSPVSQSKFVWPAGVRGAVSLTFDDAELSQIENGIPIFERFGVHATFYTLPGPLVKYQDTWRNVVARGHEIGAHTLTHPCTCNFGFTTLRPTNLENMTIEQMEGEIAESNSRIERLMGVLPVSFAYPCGQKFVGRGEQLRSYVPLVARHYLTGRGWRDEFYNAPDRCDLAQLSGIELDRMDFPQVKQQILAAAQTGNWLLLAGHHIGTETRQQMTKVSTLEAICSFCRDPANGIWLDTVGVIGSYIREVRGF